MFWWSSVWFFFFKQKTAYDMRISDWSSDVCSSDLRFRVGEAGGAPHRIGSDPWPPPRRIRSTSDCGASSTLARKLGRSPKPPLLAATTTSPLRRPLRSARLPRVTSSRSEEHTSELQSLMRISYAVLCLNKQNRARHKQQQSTYIHNSQH